MSNIIYKDNITGHYAVWNKYDFTLEIYRNGDSKFTEIFTHVLTEDDVFNKMQKFYK